MSREDSCCLDSVTHGSVGTSTLVKPPGWQPDRVDGAVGDGFDSYIAGSGLLLGARISSSRSGVPLTRCKDG
jgi:hypothetical protein